MNNVTEIINSSQAEQYIQEQLSNGKDGSHIINELKQSKHNGYDLSFDNSLAVFYYQGKAIVINSNGYYKRVTGRFE